MYHCISEPSFEATCHQEKCDAILSTFIIITEDKIRYTYLPKNRWKFHQNLSNSSTKRYQHTCIDKQDIQFMVPSYVQLSHENTQTHQTQKQKIEKIQQTETSISSQNEMIHHTNREYLTFRIRFQSISQTTRMVLKETPPPSGIQKGDFLS